MPGEPLLRLSGLAKRYGAATAVQPTDLTIRQGDFFAILGPSGCGKTTLLRMLGGFVRPSAGRIEIEGQDVTGLPPERRPTGMVFQNYGLFQHMTVRQNVAYGLRVRRLPRAEIDARVDEMLTLVDLKHLAERPAPQLSGGQRQRVALARALILRPKVLLLDEPLAALDLKLRKVMHGELRSIHRAIGGTFILVSHDQAEVMTLANRVAVMDHGAVVQEGSPREIYTRPANAFVSTFIGDANVLGAERRDGQVHLGFAAAFPDAGPDGPVSVVVRPEHVTLGTDPAAAVRVEAEILEAIFLGPFVQVRCALPGGQTLLVQTDGRRDALPEPGSIVPLAWHADRQLVMAAGR